jgi:guanosine-3',5'-bis(diphosphate) 3'-pyrophosphohydrolase
LPLSNIRYYSVSMSVKELADKEPQSLVGRAYAYAKKAHAGQKRASGEPYFTHVLATAETLFDWGMGENSIAAGLLHDTVEDTPITLEEIKKEFGDEIAFLVDGVTKLDRVKYSGSGKQMENLRKMILALSEDLRVIFIKLADRTHNMKTLASLPKEKQRRIALETEEIYAPLAYRLGMQSIAGELRDLAFPYLHPEEYIWLEKNIRAQYGKRLEYLTRIRPLVMKTLKDANLTPVSLDYRAKRMSSLYQKLLQNGMDIDRIFDLVAFRLIVRSIEDCYAALGAIHQAWPPLPGRIKDYIALPKANGYQSLHTTVIGPNQMPVEFQIRTQEMHDRAERGVAAHWVYKNAKGKDRRKTAREMADELEWLKELKGWQEAFADPTTTPEEFLEAMKVNFFHHRIFPMTPKGEVIDLPTGATPVDFAYKIHSDVGNSCVGAKVNGKIVPLDHELQTGDLVEIITQKNKKPSEDWLQFTKTSGAKDHIRAALFKKRGLFVKRPSATEFRIVVEDRQGLLKDISVAISRSHLNIIAMHADVSPGSRYPIDKIKVDTIDTSKMEKLALKLRTIKGVKEVSYKAV